MFAQQAIRSGEQIMEFRGPLLQFADLPQPYETVEDRYVQIGKDLYLGPSGDADDYINHSCDPNAGLVIIGTRVTLIAIRNILPGEEITWDYSTTMAWDVWEMECQCHSTVCRKRIRDFKYLPQPLREHYQRLGIVPEYALVSSGMP